MTNADEASAAAKLAKRRPRKMAREPKSGVASLVVTPALDKHASKAALVFGMLQRPEGVTIDQLVAATGWLPHSTRAALTGLRKKGHSVASEKLDGVRRYRIGGEAA